MLSIVSMTLDVWLMDLCHRTNVIKTAITIMHLDQSKNMTVLQHSTYLCGYFYLQNHTIALLTFLTRDMSCFKKLNITYLRNYFSHSFIIALT